MTTRVKSPELGEWAKRARAAAGFPSAQKFALTLGFPAEWLRQLEAGYYERPDPARVRAIVEASGIEAPVVAVRSTDEERLAQIVAEAYERGLREGLRIGRDGE